MLPILLFRPNDASEMAKRWFKSHDSLGGTGKAEDAKTPGAGIIPKLSPRKCVEEMEGGSNRPIGVRERRYLYWVCNGILEFAAGEAVRRRDTLVY